MPRAIAELAAQMLRDPVKVAVTPAASTVERVEQRIICVDRPAKAATLIDVLRREPIDRAIIFTRTKHGADKVARNLVRAGIGAEAIHGNKSQNQRERALAAFRKGDIKTLVATDIAARGIDVDGVSHVVNFDLPNVPETYVHRIGRTARAGAEGIAISLCDGEEVAFLRDIEKLIRMTIPASDARPDRRMTEPSHTAGATRSPAPAKQRPGRHKGPARHQNRHGEPNRSQKTVQHSNQRQTSNQRQANASTRGMESVGFMRDKNRPARHRPQHAQRWTGHSQAT